MEIRVIARGALAGLIAGILGFLFAHTFAEPQINKAIDYESGRDDAINALNAAAHRGVDGAGPDYFSRHTQSTWGLATGIIAFSVAMGALIAVAYLLAHGRFKVRPHVTIWLIAGLGFLGVYGLPFVKYPANPPAIGHEFTITTRGHLYLALVLISLVIVGLAFYAVRRLTAKLGSSRAILAAVGGALVVFSVTIGLLPSLGNLAANKEAVTDFGFARSSTETPQPITNILDKPLTVDGTTFAPGQIVYPGFDADLLWKFRWYSLLNQLLIWSVVGLVFGALCERYVLGRSPAKVKATEPVTV